MVSYFLTQVPEGKSTDLDFMRIWLNAGEAIGHQLIGCYPNTRGELIFIFRIVEQATPDMQAAEHGLAGEHE